MLRIRTKGKREAEALIKAFQEKGVLFTRIENMVCTNKTVAAQEVIKEHSATLIDKVEDTNSISPPRCVRKL